MTEDSFAKLLYRTERTDPDYRPLTLMQNAALRAFTGSMEKAEANPAAHLRNIASLAKQGLGSDILYLASAYNFPNLARAIAVEDASANPSLPGEDHFTTLDIVREQAKDNADFHPLLALLERRAQHLEAASQAAMPAPEAPTAPSQDTAPAATPAAAENGAKLTVVEQARQGMLKARAAAATEPLRPLSEEAQAVADRFREQQKHR